MGDGRLVRVLEHEFLHRADVGETCWRRLQRADREVARTQGSSVFDWSRDSVAKAKSYVGVLAVEGLTVEVLPKADDLETDASAQRNLLFMLRRAGHLPFRDAGMAGLAEEKGSLLDVFARVFAQRLLAELRRGPDRGYVRREDNLRCLRGHLLIPQNIRINAFDRTRFYVAHDQFEEDTPLNRLLKAAVYKLCGSVGSADTRHVLGVILEELSFVTDVPATAALAARVPLGRLNERFRPLRDFARRVLGATSPAPTAASQSSFSILFPMEQLYEAFVAGCLRRWAPRLGLERTQVRVQARGDRRWLLTGVHSGRGRAQLRPDVWVSPSGTGTGIVFDTKWKLVSSQERSKGVSPSDIYQMLAYAQAYQPELLLLVYPRIRGMEEREWYFPGKKHRLRVVEWPVNASHQDDEEAMARKVESWVAGVSSGATTR